MSRPLQGAEPPSGLPRVGFRVEVSSSAPPGARVKVTGELDIATASQLEVALEALVRDGVRILDVDLDRVPFCDITGLNVLLRANAAARAGGGRMRVRGECPPLRRMLDVLSLADPFELVPLDGGPDAQQDGTPDGASARPTSTSTPTPGGPRRPDGTRA